MCCIFFPKPQDIYRRFFGSKNLPEVFFENFIPACFLLTLSDRKLSDLLHLTLSGATKPGAAPVGLTENRRFLHLGQADRHDDQLGNAVAGTHRVSGPAKIVQAHLDLAPGNHCL